MKSHTCINWHTHHRRDRETDAQAGRVAGSKAQMVCTKCEAEFGASVEKGGSLNNDLAKGHSYGQGIHFVLQAGLYLRAISGQIFP